MKTKKAFIGLHLLTWRYMKAANRLMWNCLLWFFFLPICWNLSCLALIVLILVEELPVVALWSLRYICSSSAVPGPGWCPSRESHLPWEAQGSTLSARPENLRRSQNCSNGLSTAKTRKSLNEWNPPLENYYFNMKACSRKFFPQRVLFISYKWSLKINRGHLIYLE